MKEFNKIEIGAGIISVVVMAIGLITLRSDDTLAGLYGNTPDTEQGAIVVLSQEMTQKEREDSIASTFTLDQNVGKLIIDDVKTGRGAAVKNGDVVTVHFIGATQQGVQFQSTYDQNEPFTFTIGEGRVIEGWERGILGMKVGGQRVLVVPPELGYGSARVGAIPPDSSLVFTIELLEIN